MRTKPRCGTHRKKKLRNKSAFRGQLFHWVFGFRPYFRRIFFLSLSLPPPPPPLSSTSPLHLLKRHFCNSVKARALCQKSLHSLKADQRLKVSAWMGTHILRQRSARFHAGLPSSFLKAWMKPLKSGHVRIDTHTQAHLHHTHVHTRVTIRLSAGSHIPLLHLL